MYVYECMYVKLHVVCMYVCIRVHMLHTYAYHVLHDTINSQKYLFILPSTFYDSPILGARAPREQEATIALFSFSARRFFLNVFFPFFLNMIHSSLKLKTRRAITPFHLVASAHTTFNELTLPKRPCAIFGNHILQGNVHQRAFL